MEWNVACAAIGNTGLYALGFSLVVLAHTAAPLAVHAESSAPPSPVNAEFRGCESTGWCRFWIESLDRTPAGIYRVYPDGVARTPTVRDRLNALLSSMIHQSKRIVLHDLRALDDGT